MRTFILVLAAVVAVATVERRVDAGAAPSQEVAKALEQRKAMAAEFLEKVKTAKDPVALAIEATKDTFPGDEASLTPLNTAGMKCLAEHWEDPRSEATLLALTKGPVMPDVSEQVATRAAACLADVRARKNLKNVIPAGGTPEARVAAVRKAFEEHPKWLTSEEAAIVATRTTLMKEAIATGGVSVVDLVVQCGVWDIMSDFAKQHPEEYLAEVKKIGRRKALAAPYCVDVLTSTHSEKATALVLEWIKEESDGSLLRHLTSLVYRLPGAHENLLALLQDDRFPVCIAAATYLQVGFPTEATVAAIEAEIARRKAAGVPEGKLQGLSNLAEELRALLKKTAPKAAATATADQPKKQP
jgi:hypothetical protein